MADDRVYNMESSFSKGLLHVKCCISGTEEYNVSFYEAGKGYISKLERGNANLSLRTLQRLTAGMGMRVKIELVSENVSAAL